MGIKITVPMNMRLTDWADQIVMDLDAYGSFGMLLDEKDWQSWGMQFVNNAALKENIPIPYSFQDWRERAQRFCEIVE